MTLQKLSHQTPRWSLEVTVGPEGSCPWTDDLNFPRLVWKHSQTWASSEVTRNKYKKSRWQKNKVRKKALQSGKPLWGCLRAAAAWALGLAAQVPRKVPSLRGMSSLSYPLPLAETMFLVFICLPQILRLCFTRRFSSLQRICQYGLAYKAVLL